MNRLDTNWTQRLSKKQWAWAIAGITILGIGGMNNTQHGAAVPQGSWRTQGPVGGNSFEGNGFGGNNIGGGQAAPPMEGNAPSAGWGSNIPAPPAGGFTPAVQTQETTLPSSGDSVPESVNTNFSDYMRDQQRVASDNDGQTYVVNSNADPNQMTDTRDGVSGFTQAAPGSDAAGYGEVAPSGATTVDTSTATPVDTTPATPVDTSSSTSAPAAE